MPPVSATGWGLVNRARLPSNSGAVRSWGRNHPDSDLSDSGLVNGSGSSSRGFSAVAAATTISSDAGTLNLTNVGTITGATFGLTLTGAGNGTVSSIIGTTSGTLIKSGTGAWTLTGANTFTGATTVSAGILNIQNATALGTIAGTRRVKAAAPGIAVLIAALAPVGILAIAFPEGGTEPFAFSALWPVPVLAIGLLFALPRQQAIFRAGLALYALVTVASYVVPSPLGSNAARLGTLLGAPVAALLLWPRKRWLLLLVAVPLLYLEWQAPVRDLVIASGDPSASTGYYSPLLRFLEHQSGPPFRVEIPFTRFHWEAYAVASRFPSPRGWERQLDIKDNSIFYSGRLNPATYEAWLHRNAVRFVATPDAPLDYSGMKEMRLISGGLPYLRLVERTAHWRVYAVAGATAIAQGAASLQAIGPDWLTLRVARPGRTVLRVRFSPYWALSQGSGCVAPAGSFTAVTLRQPGSERLAISFALDRIGARSPRCR